MLNSYCLHSSVLLRGLNISRPFIGLRRELRAVVGAAVSVGRAPLVQLIFLGILSGEVADADVISSGLASLLEGPDGAMRLKNGGIYNLIPDDPKAKLAASPGIRNSPDRVRSAHSTGRRSFTEYLGRCACPGALKAANDLASTLSLGRARASSL